MKRGAEDIPDTGSSIGARLLRVYKAAVSPALHAIAGAPGACRYQPTCSEYAAIAVSEYGLMRGGAMAVGRLMRCHPLHRGGFDPVPSRRDSAHTSPTGQVH
jgi:hypothetical protein